MNKLLFCVTILFCCGVPALAKSEYNQGIQTHTVLQTDTTSNGAAIEYPHTPNPQVTGLKVVIPSGKETGWHKHSAPGYAYVLKGLLTIEIENGKTVQFGAGTAFAEVVETMHNGKNTGTDDVELIVFFTGENNKPFTVRK